MTFTRFCHDCFERIFVSYCYKDCGEFFFEHFLPFCLAVMIFLAVPSCKPKSEEKMPPGHPEESITISGAGTTMTILEDPIARFASAHPGISFNILPSTHTQGGLEGTFRGVLDVGAVSRLIEDNELGPDFEIFYLCRDPLIFIVHPDLPIDGLTANQVIDIYGGRITNWKEVGGDDGEIMLIGRPPFSAGRSVLEKKLFGEGFSFSPKIISVSKATDALAAVLETEKSICYSSLSILGSSSRKARILAIDGIDPLDNEDESGQYPYTRLLGVVYKKELPSHVEAFIEYLKSGGTRELLIDKGCLPWP